MRRLNSFIFNTVVVINACKFKYRKVQRDERMAEEATKTSPNEMVKGKEEKKMRNRKTLILYSKPLKIGIYIFSPSTVYNTWS